MATLHHPASLNALQQYRQARAILRGTTRASNPAWYQEALELNLQLHIRTDGASIVTFFHDRRQARWTAGPTLSEAILADEERSASFVAEVLRHARRERAPALGVVLHVADEFATTELKPEFDHPSALGELRQTALSDPGAILEDSSIAADQAAWRVMPYPAAGGDVIGTTVTLSRQHAGFFALLRETAARENFPIVTHALSAPLVALMALGEVLQPTPGKPFVAILQYPWFVALGFFNEHSDLRLIRTLQHRGLRRPTNFRNALATTSAMLEFVEPDLFVLPLAPEPDPSLGIDLAATYTNCRVERVLLPVSAGLPPWCPELEAAAPAATAPATPLSHTFTILREEKWALQDFLPTPRELAEVYPSRAEMRLLRMLRYGRLVVAGAAASCMAYFAWEALALVQQPEWAFDPAQAAAAKTRLDKLAIDRQRADHWSNLLEDRSKAWASMESLGRLFPQDGGMLVKTYSHTAKPEPAATGQPRAGFTKEWKITGYARDEALDHLNTINTREGISAHFAAIARLTGNAAFDPAVGTRSLVVNVRTQENSAFKPIPLESAHIADEASYPFTFDLTITQRFEASDPMALVVAKAP